MKKMKVSKDSPVTTIKWQGGKLRMIDQSRLPFVYKYIECKSAADVWRALRELKVRGAPVIGAAAGFGVVLAVQNKKFKDAKELLKEVERSVKFLAGARPTAVNLFWALERMRRKAAENRNKDVSKLKEILLDEAISILEEDKKVCRRMAEYGAALIKDGDSILTHCNAGALATVDYGTALGVLYKARQKGKRIKVYADETRPVLQGARLTTWELRRGGIDATLICDDMAAAVLKQKKVNKIFVGADRIARNGDFANKIGTYNLAILAKFHKIPFYAVAPLSSFDFKIKDGTKIPIEERNPEEVRSVFGKRIVPKEVKVYNPAFDVTPHKLVTAFITERGIIRPPFTKLLKRLAKTK